MALEKPQRYAKTAFKMELKFLDGLTTYYRGESSLGHVAEAVDMPLRAVMEFMQKHKLPYYWDASDSQEGLRRISELRSSL